MTREERDAIRARCEAAVSGTWIVAEMTSHKSRKGGHKYYKVVEKAHTLNQVCHYIPTAGTAEFIAHARQDIPALLDALDEVASRANNAEREWDAYIDNARKLNGVIEEIKADRDHWKSRAEALENALGRVTPRCMWCKQDRKSCGHYDPPRAHGTPCSDDPTFYCEHWQFNEARFSEPQKEERREL